MATNSDPSTIAYHGDGRTTAFPVPFTLFGEGDVEVRLNGVQELVGFKVAGGIGGGMVIFSRPPAAGATVQLRRLLNVAQPPTFEGGGGLSAKAVRQEFDRMSAVIQQIAEDVGRAVTRSPLSPSTADLTLPEPVPGHALTWNEDGTALANSGASLEALTAQAAAHASQAGTRAGQAAGSANLAAQSAQEAKAAEAALRVLAGDATRTIEKATDLSVTEARKAQAIVAAVADPGAAYRKLKLIGIW